MTTSLESIAVLFYVQQPELVKGGAWSVRGNDVCGADPCSIICVP